MKQNEVSPPPKKKDSKRYYLHRMFKKQNIKYNPYLNTIYVGIDEDTENKYIKRAQDEFDYSVQTEIR